MPSNDTSFTTTFAAYPLGFWLVNALQRIKSSVGWQNLLALKAASYSKKMIPMGRNFGPIWVVGPSFLGGSIWGCILGLGLGLGLGL